MRTRNLQVLRLRAERARGHSIEVAAMKAGMHRNTARRYLSGLLPSERVSDRTWRTREDPFAEDWARIVTILDDVPDVEAKALFEHLQGLAPGRYEDGHLRTFQRRVKEWRAKFGPEKEIFFPQAHRPGEAMQTDFTHASELDVTIQGQPYPHLLCVSVLPYSGWWWATPCASESMVALVEGLQNAVFELGHVAQYHQTDHSTGAIHHGKEGWRFHDGYLAATRHLGTEPRVTGVGEKEQNGSIEATNGALKRRLHQELLLRGSRDFESVAAYRTWLEARLRRRNQARRGRLAEELAVMRAVGVTRLPAFVVVRVRVGGGSTIRAKSCTYSVPSRLIGEKVCVHVHEGHLEVYLGGQLQDTMTRVRGRGAYNVNWRHVIGWMVKKPGALRRYVYRDALFPTATFRATWERLDATLSNWSADTNYLQILKLARDAGQTAVEQELAALLAAGEAPHFDALVTRMEREPATVPALDPPPVDLGAYDDLTPQACQEMGR